MSSCSWSRSAYCVSTLCIRSSIEPATIRYRRIIAYIYCSSCLSKRPNDRAQVFNPHNRRLPNLLSSRQSLLTPSFVSSRDPRRYPYARPQQVERLLPYPEADKRTRRRTPFPSMRRFKSLPSLDVRAQWKHHSRLLRRSWALLSIEPTVMRQRNGKRNGKRNGRRDPAARTAPSPYSRSENLVRYYVLRAEVSSTRRSCGAERKPSFRISSSISPASLSTMWVAREKVS